MSRRIILTGVVLAVALGATAAAAALSAADGGKASTVCNLSNLRVTKTTQAPGMGELGMIEQFLYVRFVNDGPACTVGPRSAVTMTAKTNTPAVVRAKLTLSRTNRLAAREAVTAALGTWWQLRSACHSAHFSSVVFHIAGSSKAVSLRHPYTVCRPFKAQLF